LFVMPTLHHSPPGSGNAVGVVHALWSTAMKARVRGKSGMCSGRGAADYWRYRAHYWARPMMVKSHVVDNKSGKSVDSQIRTSTGTFFGKAEDDIIERIEKRVAQVTMIPVENQEGLQILHYHNGQKYEPHFDFFHDQLNTRPENGGQRVATVLMYLTTAEEGGETVFPNADRKSSGPEWSECAKNGMAVKTLRGDALMFYSLKPDGSNDQASLHGSCPTLKGDKWSATKWIHVGPFQ
ncbi:Fe2OG dioxygenase domain-containing protein, partial [Haematococcus lacustris]